MGPLKGQKMDSLKLKAMAKINLGLDVVGKREDGYHEVRMIMQMVNLFDQVTVKKTSDGEITVKTNLSFLPTNQNNIVYKAAQLLKTEFGLTEGVHIELEKHIPVAAGMAGGSTDGATVLFAMNRIFKLGLDQKALMERGVKLGADVPYCVMRGTALSEGIGEILTPLPDMPPCHILVAKPGISVSTKFVYENLRANELAYHPDIDGMTQAIKSGDLRGITDRMSNVLETVTINSYPVIEEIKTHMKNHGAMNALMSGSGPTVFGIFETREEAANACSQLRKSGLARHIFLTEPFYLHRHKGKKLRRKA